MKKQRTPREKKELEYKKDHISGAEYPHAFRKSWPRKEAAARRAFRRKVRQLNRTLEAHGEDNFPEGAEPEIIKRSEVRKWPVIAMGEVIPRRIERRLLRTAWNFFKDPYDSARDRERFSAFLASQVGGRTEQSEKLAAMFQHAMDGGKASLPGSWSAGLDFAIPQWPRYIVRWNEWLKAFFRDEPDWEQRLRGWIHLFEDREDAENRSAGTRG